MAGGGMSLYCDHCGEEVSGLIHARPPWFRRWFPYWVQRLLLINDRTAVRAAMRESLIQDVRRDLGPEYAALMGSQDDA